MWEETDFIRFTNFKKNRVMDFRISADSKCTNISPQLGRQFDESCEVITVTDDLLQIFRVLNFRWLL